MTSSSRDAVTESMFLPPLHQDRDQGHGQAAGHHAGHLSGHVDPDGLLDDEIGGIFLQGHFGDDPSGNGEGADAAGPDHGIDLFLQEQVGQFGEEQAPHRIENEGHGPQGQDLQHLDRQDIFGGHGGPYGDPQQQGHQVGQSRTV